MMKPGIQAFRDRSKVDEESLMARMNPLILAIKCSPFVPIKLYRDLTHPRELLSDRTTSTTSFSLSSMRALEPAGLGREI
jgi:hypothetical protein